MSAPKERMVLEEMVPGPTPGTWTWREVEPTPEDLRVMESLRRAREKWAEADRQDAEKTRGAP